MAEPEGRAAANRGRAAGAISADEGGPATATGPAREEDQAAHEPSSRTADVLTLCHY